jgi:hypothetical protein
MILEMIKHSLGLCGEGHATFFHIIPFLGGVIYMLKHNIKWCWKQGCEFCIKKIKKINHDKIYNK